MKIESVLGPIASAYFALAGIVLGFVLVVIATKRELQEFRESPPLLLYPDGTRHDRFKWRRVRTAVITASYTVLIGLCLFASWAVWTLQQKVVGPHSLRVIGAPSEATLKSPYQSRSESQVIAGLKREAFNLSWQLNEFYAKYNNAAKQGLKPGATLTDAQTKAVFVIMRDGVKQYHATFDNRISRFLRTASKISGKDTKSLESDALNIDGYALDIVEGIAVRLSMLGGSL